MKATDVQKSASLSLDDIAHLLFCTQAGGLEQMLGLYGTNSNDRIRKTLRMVSGQAHQCKQAAAERGSDLRKLRVRIKLIVTEESA